MYKNAALASSDAPRAGKMYRYFYSGLGTHRLGYKQKTREIRVICNRTKRDEVHQCRI